MLSYVLQYSPVHEKMCSPHGRKLILDCCDVIKTARLTIREKNADALFQNFVWYTRDVNWDHAKKDPEELRLIDPEKAKTGRSFSRSGRRTSD
jgi:hypothetical protein